MLLHGFSLLLKINKPLKKHTGLTEKCVKTKLNTLQFFSVFIGQHDVTFDPAAECPVICTCVIHVAFTLCACDGAVTPYMLVLLLICSGAFNSPGCSNLLCHCGATGLNSGSMSRTGFQSLPDQFLFQQIPEQQ